MSRDGFLKSQMKYFYTEGTKIIKNGDCTNRLEVLSIKDYKDEYLIYYNGNKSSEIFSSLDEIEEFLNKEDPNFLDDCKLIIHPFESIIKRLISIKFINAYFISEEAKYSLFNFDKMLVDNGALATEAIKYYANKNNLEVNLNFGEEMNAFNKYVRKAFPKLNDQELDKISKDIKDMIYDFDIKFICNKNIEDIQITEDKSSFYISSIGEIKYAPNESRFNEAGSFGLEININGIYDHIIFTNLDEEDIILS